MVGVFRKSIKGSYRSDKTEPLIEAAMREVLYSQRFKRIYPYVPEVYSLTKDIEEGDWIITQQKIEGEDLQQFLFKHPEMITEMYKKVDYIANLLSTTSFLHGDLYHLNLMVDKEFNVWLIDFGHAREKEKGEETYDKRQWNEVKKEWNGGPSISLHRFHPLLPIK